MIINNYVAIFLLSLGLVSVAHSEEEGADLFKQVTKTAKKCAASVQSNTQAASCYIKATPKKCQQEVINYLSSSEKDDAVRAWYFCVSTCAGASFWSRNFGECSRESQ